MPDFQLQIYISIRTETGIVIAIWWWINFEYLNWTGAAKHAHRHDNEWIKVRILKEFLDYFIFFLK